MRNKQLDAVLADLRRVTAIPRMESACQQLTKAIWEIKKVRRSGRVEEKRIVRVVALVSDVLLNTVCSEDVDPDHESDREQAG